MTFLDSLRKNLTPEMYTQVVDALGDDFDSDLVPRSRLNKVIKQRNELRAQLAGDSQNQNGNAGKSDDDDDVNPKGGNAGRGTNIEELKKQLKAESDKAIQEVKIQYAALEQLRAANVIDPELIWSSSILDKSKITLDDTGKLVGLEDMLTQLKKDKAHLFGKADDGVPGGTGKDGGDDGFKGVTSKEEFLKLDMDKQIAFKTKNPEMFKTFMSAT